jgi:TonB-dependent SusC/RagA subfamily outer membrane receptor
MLSSQRSALVFALLAASVVGCSRQTNARPAPPGAAPTTIREVTRIEELLEGHPGVIVQRTVDGGYAVRVRGVGSFASGEEPLWVVDGMQVDHRGRGLSWLNPADVVRIEVLKNAVDTAIYGVRGSNGVIVITTKRAR